MPPVISFPGNCCLILPTPTHLQVTAEWTPRAAAALASDVAVASLLLALHGATLMSQVGGTVLTK